MEGGATDDSTVAGGESSGTSSVALFAAASPLPLMVSFTGSNGPPDGCALRPELRWDRGAHLVDASEAGAAAAAAGGRSAAGLSEGEGSSEPVDILPVGALLSRP